MFRKVLQDLSERGKFIVVVIETFSYSCWQTRCLLEITEKVSVEVWELRAQGMARIIFVDYTTSVNKTGVILEIEVAKIIRVR